MSTGAMIFMIGAWAIIIGAVIITLSSLLKHSK